MNISIQSRYNVDNVPMSIKPQFYVCGYGTGLLLFMLLLTFRSTIRIEVSGREKLLENSNHIFCLWHSFVPMALISATPSIPLFLENAPQAWMQHPVWYMKPIHVLLRLMGVKKIIPGSTGHSGREAADKLVNHLRAGCSTVLNPDGPNGPAFVLKKGILHLSLKSGVPIVALRFSSTNCRELNTWDRKKIPLPFSAIKLHIGEPFHVTRENFEHASKLIECQMGLDFTKKIN